MKTRRIQFITSLAPFRGVLPVIFCLGLLLHAGCMALNQHHKPLRFEVFFSPNVRERPVNCRVLLFLSPSASDEPRKALIAINPFPVFAKIVENLSPGEPVIFVPTDFQEPDAMAFSKPMTLIEPGVYYAQALFDIDQTVGSYADGPENLYSNVRKVRINRNQGGTIRLVADKVVEVQEPQDTDWVKLVSLRSDLLSRFHGRDVLLNAGVILPPGYHEEESPYPVVYEIPGFGGRHTRAWHKMRGEFGRVWKAEEPPLRALWVALDPEMRYGHSLFADSANNGPVGQALIQELIPEIERRFRVIQKPQARLVTGHSSGGWSSLWLQVTYPEFFGGCWSKAPDPVDFRAFQVINIYQDENAYWDSHGFPRPSIRRQGEIRLSIRNENRLEYVTGPGEQWNSWFAVFGPRNPEGLPSPLWDPLSGEINRVVADYWRAYDIRALLEDNWSQLEGLLKGKLHVLCGTEDNYYLNRAVKRLKGFLDPMDHGGYVEILPGGHGSFLTKPIRKRILQEMADSLDKVAPIGEL